MTAADGRLTRLLPTKGSPHDLLKWTRVPFGLRVAHLITYLTPSHEGVKAAPPYPREVEVLDAEEVVDDGEEVVVGVGTLRGL